MSDLPRMLYRPGYRLNIEGHLLDALCANDERELAELREDGWLEIDDILAGPAEEPHPLDHDGDGVKGGSLPGEQSTRAQGQRKELTVKP